MTLPDAGLRCVDCPAPALGQQIRCAACRERHRLACAAWRRKSRPGRLTRTVLPTVQTLTSGQVAFILDVAPRTATRWIDTGRLKGHRLPGSQDRRVRPADLVAFMAAHDIPVPMGLLALTRAGARLALACEAPPGFEATTLIGLGGVLATRPVAALVAGDADGLAAAAAAAAAVRGLNPAALVALVLDPANAGYEPPPGAFDLVRVRPCDVAQVAADLTGGAAVA